jgi:hypothetical protein
MFLNNFSLALLFFISSLTLSPPVGYAEVAYSETTKEKVTLPPVERGKKIKKKKKRSRKKNKQAKHNNDIVPNLYATFITMAMFPLFVIIGLFLIGFCFPLLIYFCIGIALIVIGDGATLIGGAVAGASNTYSTQVLSFALWLLFFINVIGGIAFLVMYFNFLLGFYGLFLLAISLLIIAIFMLIWALVIRRQNKAFRNT